MPNTDAAREAVITKVAAIDERLEELAGQIATLMTEQLAYYLEAEGFIDVDEAGCCYPTEAACPNTL